MEANQMELLKKVQHVELEILNEVDRICRKNDLKYSLAYGTLIGAVRHKGFIPWDDDIDIVMPRKDYERLRTIWKNESTHEYYLQDYKEDLYYPKNFMKIRRNNTAFIESDKEFHAKYHTGIFIDIFPMDRLAPNGIQRKEQFAALALNLLYSRGYKSGRKGIYSVIESILLLMPRSSYLALREKTEAACCKWDHLEDAPLLVAATIEDCKKYFDSDLFDNLIEIPFEETNFMCTSKYDSFLRSYYGNYMELPPEEERVCKHHPKFISLDSNYKPDTCYKYSN